jgi:hypothetical protein
MAAEAIELIQTRDMSYSAGKTVATRRFAIWDDAGTLQTPRDVRDLFGTTVGTVEIPDRNFLFPDEVGIYARSYTLRRRDDGSGVWDLEWSYENGEPIQLQPQEIGYTEFSIDWNAEFREVWRTNPGINIPVDGIPTIEGQDIGGVSIDSGGVPLTVMHYFNLIEFSETVPIESLNARSINIRFARGKRNAQVFEGAARGTVLYKGAKANRISVDKVRLVHSFAQDSFMHLIQVPVKLADGLVELLEKPAGSGLLRAQTVTYRQPFPDFANFGALSENF